jgi:hypothetical protein
MLDLTPQQIAQALDKYGHLMDGMNVDEWDHITLGESTENLLFGLGLRNLEEDDWLEHEKHGPLYRLTSALKGISKARQDNDNYGMRMAYRECKTHIPAMIKKLEQMAEDGVECAPLLLSREDCEKYFRGEQ